MAAFLTSFCRAEAAKQLLRPPQIDDKEEEDEKEEEKKEEQEEEVAVARIDDVILFSFLRTFILTKK